MRSYLPTCYCASSSGGCKSVEYRWFWLISSCGVRMHYLRSSYATLGQRAASPHALVSPARTWQRAQRAASPHALVSPARTWQGQHRLRAASPHALVSPPHSRRVSTDCVLLARTRWPKAGSWNGPSASSCLLRPVFYRDASSRRQDLRVVHPLLRREFPFAECAGRGNRSGIRFRGVR